MRDAPPQGMVSRSLLALIALVSVAGCHRRTFEDRAAAREDVIITSSPERGGSHRAEPRAR
jgi:hypothetical protein